MKKCLTMDQARKAMADDRSIRVIDIRSPEEYERGHIAESINVPLEDIEDVVDIIKDRNTKIFICCQSGKRSSYACCKLMDAGYANIWNIGGVKDWTYGLQSDV